MVKTLTGKIKMNRRLVQQQGKGVDCGLFAIAVTLEFRHEPEMISYDEGNLRRHLAECLKSEKFSHFPEYKRQAS